MALRINKEVNVWSVGTTVAAVVISFTWLQADVRALQTKDIEIQARITEARSELARLETIFGKRIDIADQRAERDREAILTIQGDIRVVRQILESMRVPAMAPHPPR